MRLGIKWTPWRVLLAVIAALVVITLSRELWLPAATAVKREMVEARKDYKEAHTKALSSTRATDMAVAPSAVAQDNVTPVMNLPKVETDEERAERKLAEEHAKRSYVKTAPASN